MTRTQRRIAVATALLMTTVAAPAAYSMGPAPAPPGFPCAPTGVTIIGGPGDDVLTGWRRVVRRRWRVR